MLVLVTGELLSVLLHMVVDSVGLFNRHVCVYAILNLISLHPPLLPPSLYAGLEETVCTSKINVTASLSTLSPSPDCHCC